MMNSGKDYYEIMRRLGEIFLSEKFEDVSEIKLREGYEMTYLCYVDDVVLTDKQFSALSRLMENDGNIYIMNSAFDLAATKPQGEKEYPEMCEIYSFRLPMGYDEYVLKFEDIRIQPLIMLFDDSFEWVVVTDENRVDGHGVFIAKNVLTGRFRTLYPDWKDDEKLYRELFAGE